MQSSSIKSPQEENIPPSVVSGLAYQVVDQYISSLFSESGPLEYSGKMNHDIKSRIKYYYDKNDADLIKNRIYELILLKLTRMMIIKLTRKFTISWINYPKRKF